MHSTIFLAQFTGVFFVIAGLSMALRRKMLMTVFNEMFQTRALSYILGLMSLLVGLFIVLQHNLWNGSLEIIISILGWYLFIESIPYLFISQEKMKRALNWLENRKVYYGIAFGYLMLGSYLVCAGFFLY
jgi:hypothetical protein